MRKLSIVLFAALSVFAGSAQAIGNGKLAMTGDVVARSIVDLRVGGNHCSATVLDKTLLLTAAHCTFFYGESRVREAMPWELTAQQPNDGKFIKVKKIIRNAVPVEGTGNVIASEDIAVLELESPLSNYFQPVKIAEGLPKNLEVLQIAGIGPAETGGAFGTVRSGEVIFNELDYVDAVASRKEIVKELNEVGLDVRPANRIWSTTYSISKTMDRAYICGGDSGGALFAIENNRMVQFGVASAKASNVKGSTCAEGYGDNQYFAAIFAENKIFVALAIYQQLGKVPEFSLEARETNPQYFEYNKINYATLPRKNKWIDLEDLRISLGKADTIAHLVNLKTVQNCKITNNDVMGVFSTADLRKFDVAVLLKEESYKALERTRYHYPVPVVMTGWAVGPPTAPWIMILTPDGYVAGPTVGSHKCGN
jgi:hypothetical protein